MVKRPCSRQIKKAKNKKCQQKKQSEEFKRKATKKNRIDKSKRSGQKRKAVKPLTAGHLSASCQKVLKVNAATSGQVQDPREILWEELQSIELDGDRLFPEGWTVRLGAPIPQDGIFSSLSQYQRIWEEVLILETKSQYLSEIGRRYHVVKQPLNGTSFEARCLDESWALLNEVGSRRLHPGTVMLLHGDVPRLGRVVVTPSGSTGIVGTGFYRKGAFISATPLNVSLASVAREIHAIRDIRRVPVVLVTELLGDSPRDRGPEYLEDLECLKSLNPSQETAVRRAASYNNSGFVSIHGPPGTGKSQTLLALINTLHLQKFGEMILGEHNQRNAADKWKKAVHNFPRLLITAHSNSAVQQLQQRTSAGCFVDRDGRPYIPNHCRLSSHSAESFHETDDAKSENVDAKIRFLFSLKLETLKAERQERQKEMDALSKGIVKLMKEIKQLQEVCPLPVGIQAYIEKGQIQYVDEQTGEQYIDRPPTPRFGEPMTLPLQLTHVTGRIQDLLSVDYQFMICEPS
eukprot:symbB.v1.2.035253.t1/scaffold4702.1/size36141/2